MNDAVKVFAEAGKTLDQMNGPRKASAFMNHETYMALGGTQEIWDDRSEDGLIYLEYERP